MIEKKYDLGRYMENPPSIFEILGTQSKTEYQNLHIFLKTLHDQLLPLLGNLRDILEKVRYQMENFHQIEKNKQIFGDLRELEKEYLWAQFIELESQKRAVSDLTQKLQGEISINRSKEDEISASLLTTRPQFQQKNDTVQTEFKKFRVINGELQQMFKDQNQILRKINQIESNLNNPKAKKTPDEISTLEKELKSLQEHESETRRKLPQKQKELEGQRLLHQQKEKEFRPLKIKFDGQIAEQAKLEQLIKTDSSRLEEKQKELSGISNKIQEFLTTNNLKPEYRPAIIRTKNIIEDKIKGIKANVRPDSKVQSDGKSPSIENDFFLPTFEKLLSILGTFQLKPIQNEIRLLSKEIANLRNQYTPKFANIMNALGKKGGIQAISLISSNGTLRYIEERKDKSIASLIAFLLALYGEKANPLEIDTSALSPTQIEVLVGITKTFESKANLKIKIIEG